MADKRPTELTTEETTLRGFVHSDDATNGSRKFNLARIGNALALRAPASQAISDGSTTSRAMRFTLGTRGNLAGASVATWAGFVTVPTSNPSTNIPIAQLATTTTTDFYNQANSLGVAFTTTGSLNISARGTTPASDARTFFYSGFITAYGGQTIFLSVLFTNGTTNPVVRVNGVDVSSGFSPSTTGTPPDWLSSSLVGTNALLGYNWPAGDAPLGCWINAALTDADRTYWLTHGVPPQWVMRGGSMANGVTVPDLSTSTGNWATAFGSTVAYDAVDAETDFTCGPAGGGMGYGRVAAGLLTNAYYNPIQIGAVYRVDYYVSKPLSAGTTMELTDSAVTPKFCDLDLSSVGLKSVTFVATRSPTQFRITNYDAYAGRTFSLSYLNIRPIGALGYPVVGPDRFVRDATRISPPIDGYMVGMRPLSTDADGWIRGRRTSPGYLQADTQLVGDGRGVVQVLMRSVSGGTASLGESAGSPATVVASLSLTAGVWTPCTILKSVVSGGKLYVGGVNVGGGSATDAEVAVRTGPILSLV